MTVAGAARRGQTRRRSESNADPPGASVVFRWIELSGDLYSSLSLYLTLIKTGAEATPLATI
jgi:hypothetical protein